MIRFRASVSALVLALTSLVVVPLPTQAADTSTISGVVVAHDGSLVTDATAFFRVEVFSLDGVEVAFGGINRTTGAFTTGAFPTQPVKLRVYYWGNRADVFKNSWLPDGAALADAGTYTPAAGTNSLSITLPRPAAVTGSISAPGGLPLGELNVSISGNWGDDGPTDTSVIVSDSDSTPQFSFGRLKPGVYGVGVRDDSGFWAGYSEQITVTSFGQQISLNIQLQRSATIEGTVAVAGLVGGMSGDVVARSVDDPFAYAPRAAIAPDGTYSIRSLPPGRYNVCVEAGSPRNWAESCWEDSPGSIGVIDLEENEVVIGRDISTDQYGGIRGSLRSESATGPEINGSLVARIFQRTDAGYVFVEEVGTGWPFSSNYVIGSLEPGTYAIEFSHLEGWFSREYWEDSRYFSDRTDVEVVAGPSVVLGETVLSPRSYDRERLAGPDRFSTAVAVSQELFADGSDVPVVYVANGYNYPDALAAGPAAAHEGGGLLLVDTNGIPAVVAAELERLDPDRIVVLGGPAAVSDTVKSALAAYAPTVVRVGGADRFETARKIVQYAWQGETSVHAFIATAYNFPDALAAAPAAGVRDAPIILVNGGASSLDTATRNLLSSLEVEAIHIVGGPNGVSPGIEASVSAIVGPDNYVRYAGVDRFATATLVSIGNFGVADHAFVATGYGFADALAGGPLAAAVGSPLYLSNGVCILNYVLSDIEAVGANKVYFLGGTAVLSNAVYGLQSCGGDVASNEVASEIFRLPEGVSREE